MAKRSKLTAEERQQIDDSLQRGESLESVAAAFGCHRNTLERRLARDGWEVEQVEMKITRRLRRIAPETSKQA